MDASVVSSARVLTAASEPLAGVIPFTMDRAPSEANVPISVDLDAASPSIAPGYIRRRTKWIAWIGFGGMLILTAITLAGIVFSQLWLSALAAPAAVSGFGLLYTAGMDLNEIDRKLSITYRD